MSNINYVLQFHPNFITGSLFPQFSFTCVKLILKVRYFINNRNSLYNTPLWVRSCKPFWIKFLRIICYRSIRLLHRSKREFHRSMRPLTPCWLEFMYHPWWQTKLTKQSNWWSTTLWPSPKPTLARQRIFYEPALNYTRLIIARFWSSWMAFKGPIKPTLGL